jgi:hypothetical protein
MTESSAGTASLSFGAGGAGFVAAVTEDEATRAGDWRRGRERKLEASKRKSEERKGGDKVHTPASNGSQSFPPDKHKVHAE